MKCFYYLIYKNYQEENWIQISKTLTQRKRRNPRMKDLKKIEFNCKCLNERMKMMK